MSNNIYSWREAPRLKGARGADAQAVGECLEAIAGDADISKLKPKAIVAAAKNDPVLHPHFEWDDSVAADLHRRQQARSLINALRVQRITSDGEAISVPAFVSITAPGESGPAYKTPEQIENSADLQRAMLRQALRDLKGWMSRYATLVHICSMLQPVVDALEQEQERYELVAAQAADSVKRKDRVENSASADTTLQTGA